MSRHSAMPLKVVQDWLDEQQTMNTRRKYDAQFQQFCEWMILHGTDLTSVNAVAVEHYLADVAIGKASLSSRWPVKPRGPKTVTLARSVLRSIFKALIRAGCRQDNPADLAQMPATEAVAALENRSAVVSWANSRTDILARATAGAEERSALLRAVAIAELAWWAGLRRSELAVAVMANFRSPRGKLGPWTVTVSRFGQGPVDVIEVPTPAMHALSVYRQNRGLSPWPSPDETEVPLISRLRSEHPVDPWTVASALNSLLPSDSASRNGSRTPTILALRRELTLSALKAKIPAGSLAKHMRSKRLVDQLTAQQPMSAIAESLERLVA